MPFRIHPRVAWQMIEGQVVLIDLGVGRAIGLNPAASFLWSRLETSMEPALVEDLAQEYDLPPERAAADVAAFLGLLRERELVVEAQ